MSRSAQNRISAAERKRRTRRLILMGTHMEHITTNDPAAKNRLMKGLDGFLERDRDRDLFRLDSLPVTHWRSHFSATIAAGSS